MNYLITILLFPLLVACSSTSVLLAPENNSLPAQIRFQSVEYKTELSREHQAVIERVALAALRNRGFLVANTENSDLPSVLLTITTLRRDTVLAGHVNTISGQIDFFDSSKKLIAAGKHTESERGGLLFNSGQILKGITSEINNLEGDGFDDWIERFAMSLSGTLPKPDTSSELLAANRQPVISNVQVTKREKNHEVCFESPNAATATLHIENTTFPMRQVKSNGSFCVTIPEWLLSGLDYSAATVRVSSAFGIRSTQEIILADMKNLCSDLQILGVPQAGMIEFSVLCGSQMGQCIATGPCEQYTFRLYQVQDSGAFKLAGEFGIEGLTLGYLSTKPAQEVNFRVFLLKGSDSFQKPVLLTFNSVS